MITAHLTGSKISSNSPDAFSLYEKSRFGEKKENKIEYSLIEAIYLVSKQKIQIISNKKILNKDQLIKKAKKFDRRIETKMPVYSSLREKGYILKTALKFGADFRVYQKGIKPGDDHALWVLYCVHEHETNTWQDFSAKNRVAHSTKKNLLIGVVDDEEDVTYYQVGWIRP